MPYTNNRAGKPPAPDAVAPNASVPAAAPEPRAKGLGAAKAAVALTLAALAAKVVMAASKTGMVVALGIRAYNAAQSFATGAAALFGIAAGAAAIRYAVAGAQQKRLTQKSADLRLESEAKRKREDSIFSLVKLLEDVATDPAVPPEAREALKTMRAQMADIDSAQAKLHRLLQENDATLLSDTEDLLNGVEQAICKNVRGAINYANVLDLDKPSDATYFLTQASDYVVKNQELLNNVQSFLLLTTRYLNEHDEQFDPGTIDSYKMAIQKMLDRGQA